MMSLARASLMGTAAVALAGCASAPARTASSAGASPEASCFEKREVNVIRTLDDRHAFVKVSAGRFYLLTVDKTCQGLALARSIAIVEARPRICGDGMSMLSFADPAVGPMRCRIELVDSVADQNAAQDLIDSRRER